MATILGIVGSLREKSYNRALVRAFMERAPQGVTVELGEIGDLPLYNEDLAKAAFPEEAHRLKQQIEKADALLIATPEYNRSVPGVLKNAIDWASRPSGENSFVGKRVLIVGASPGSAGAMAGQYALKQSLLHLDAHVLGQPEFHLGKVSEKFDEEGKLTDTDTGDRIDAALRALVAAA